MKFICIVSFLFSAFASADELQPKDLLGLWKVEHGDIKGEGIRMEAEQVALFLEDGSSYVEVLGHMIQDAQDLKLLSLGGPDLEAWSIKDGKLITQTKKLQYDLILSSFEPDVLAGILAELNKEIETPVTYTLVEKTVDKIILKDVEENTVSTYSRIKEGKLTSLLSLKNKKDIELLFKDPKRLVKGTHDYIGQQLRRVSQSLLTSEKFKFTENLPTFSNRPEGVNSLRDRREILDRLLCSYIVGFWTVAPEEQISSKQLQALVKGFDLADKMTKKEKEILAMSRADANKQHSANIGWKLENMYALAWVLGMDICPQVTDAQAGDEVVQPIIAHIEKEMKALKAGKPLTKMRTMRQVTQLEDIFYCAHNAVRSAQLGKKNTLPKGFHPIRNGGVISEKRHALTWALSPKVKWVDTDLSS